MPEEWKLASLAEVCNGQLQSGPFGSQLHAHEYKTSGVPVIMPKDLLNGRIDISGAARISLERAEKLKRHKLMPGDLIFSRRGDVARVAVVREHEAGYVCGTGCLRARPNSAIAHPTFLIELLQSEFVRRWLEANAVGQTMPNLNTQILSELPLKLPPISAQKKFAMILGAWDDYILRLQRLLVLKRKRKRGLMQVLMTGKKRFKEFHGQEWRHLRLRDLARINYGKSPKGISDEHGTWPMYGTGGLIGFASKALYDEESIVLGRKGTIGNVQYVPNGFWAIDTTFYLDSFQNVLPRWLSYYLHHYRPERLNEASGVPSLSRDAIYSIPVLVPPVDEQRRIASVLSTADAEIEKLEKQLEAYKRQKRGLMQVLLTGKKRVRVDDLEPVLS